MFTAGNLLILEQYLQSWLVSYAAISRIKITIITDNRTLLTDPEKTLQAKTQSKFSGFCSVNMWNCLHHWIVLKDELIIYAGICGTLSGAPMLDLNVLRLRWLVCMKLVPCWWWWRQMTTEVKHIGADKTQVVCRLQLCTYIYIHALKKLQVVYSSSM